MSEKGWLYNILILFLFGIEIKSQSLLNLGFGGLTGIPDLVNCFNESFQLKIKKHPDIGLTTDKVIRKHGYPVETHKVITEDGYILTVFRIPFSRKSPSVQGKRKKAVYLNHGLGGNGQQWILQWGDRNLGYLLADSGFDVFLSNSRGTKYSMEHLKYNNDETDYWDFSWDEMGRFDVPAVMNMITNVTGNEKMYYVGHSQGTTQFLVAMSERVELNKRIHTGFLLAPSAFLSHSTNLIRHLAPLARNGQYLKDPKVGGAEESIKNHLERFTDKSLYQVCTPSPFQCVACSNIIFLQFGYDGPQTNFTELPLYLSIFPDTASTKCSVHNAQSIADGTFRKFDYGNRQKNKLEYGTTTPPDYSLEKITAPVVIAYGQNDNLCTPQDVIFTGMQLRKSTLKKIKKVKWNLFTHMDFATAIQARELVYDDILSVMQKGTYENQQVDSF